MNPHPIKEYAAELPVELVDPPINADAVPAATFELVPPLNICKSIALAPLALPPLLA